VARLLAEFPHEELRVRHGRRSGLTMAVAVHSTTLGPACGGCRVWRYSAAEHGIEDALRLSRAMTYKAAAAELPLGGGKGVVMLDGAEAPRGRRRRAMLEDFGELVDGLGGAYRTAEDVGMTSRDMAVIAGVTPHVTGLARSRGGSGDPSPSTALGVETAIRAALEHATGSGELRGRTVAIQGLGHVGGRLAARLVRAGARLVATDVVAERRDLAERLGARWAGLEEILAVPADVLAPCALGGVLTGETAGALQAPVVAGAANNQLADDAVAEQLAARGVLWVPDFVANAGGIVNIAEELGGYDPARARRRVLRIGTTVAGVLAEADATGTTPLAAALARAERRLRRR
jgi:leucine dehydrogenase